MTIPITENGTANGTTNGITNEAVNGTPNGAENETANGTINGVGDETANGTPKGAENKTANGTTNGVGDETANRTTNGAGDETANGTTNGAGNKTANGHAEQSEHNTNNDSNNINKKIHVIIIGAGLTGLLLAQGLRKLNRDLESQGFPAKYTYCVYERDESQWFRGGGFSLTIHWALQHVYEMLPPDLAAQIYDCTGNKPAMEKGQMGHFTYLNLRTGHPLHRVPVPPDWKGARMARVKFIKLLMTDVHVEYSKRLSNITFPNDSTVCATFKDGQHVTGDLLVGADGSNSAVRQFLYGAEKSKNDQLPVRMINTRCEYPLEELQECLDIDPHTFHGGDPAQNGYFFFAFLDLPSPESESAKSTAGVQMTFTWPYAPGYLGEKEPSDPPDSQLERLAWLKRMAKHWVNPLGDLIQRMPEDSILLPVTIAEWLPSDAIPRKTNGRVTMVGDSAHLMTSCKYTNPNIRLGLDLLTLISSWGECQPWRRRCCQFDRSAGRQWYRGM